MSEATTQNFLSMGRLGTPPGWIRQRQLRNLEFRPAEVRGLSGRGLRGYAATWDVEARIADFTEVIRRGAFAASLVEGQDVLALADHDPARVLARTRSGTLRLAEDDHGLAFSLDLPETTAGRDILALAERGDLGGMSFGFTVAPDGERWEGRRRELRAVRLHEISVVSSWPAYPETMVQARALTPRLNLARRYMETLL